MQGTEIVGYTYDADYHCIECAEKRFGADLEKESTEDSEGNPIHPVFASDEDWEDAVCGDCLVSLSDRL